MSLNRCEDALLRYVSDRPDERRFWSARVLEVDRAGGPLVERVAALADTFGGGRVSMRNLAEHLLHLWTPPKPQARRRAS